MRDRCTIIYHSITVSQMSQRASEISPTLWAMHAHAVGIRCPVPVTTRKRAVNDDCLTLISSLAGRVASGSPVAIRR